MSNLSKINIDALTTLIRQTDKNLSASSSSHFSLSAQHMSDYIFHIKDFIHTNGCTLTKCSVFDDMVFIQTTPAVTRMTSDRYIDIITNQLIELRLNKLNRDSEVINTFIELTNIPVKPSISKYVWTILVTLNLIQFVIILALIFGH